MDDPLPGCQLLAASTGGHLAQLAKWSQTIGSNTDSLWVTFKSPQSESLLRNCRVMYVPYVAPRDLHAAMNAFFRMMKEIDWKEEGFTAAVTTGAALGLAALAAARSHHVPSFYFESVSRVNGPSLSGKLASLDPRIHTYCQYEHWAGRRWKHRRSLFDSYETLPKPVIERPRLFVTLGTIYPYRFDALVDAVLLTGLADSRTVWQLGATTGRALPGTAVSQMGAAEFEDCARASDVVITHAGVGTIMYLLEMGLFPVVVPRRAKRNEHVDDHQAQIAGLLNSRAISMVTEADELDRNTIIAASATSVCSAGEIATRRDRSSSVQFGMASSPHLCSGTGEKAGYAATILHSPSQRTEIT
jgi:UDP-N-acetylglucosamine transferase subunit ALG13